MNIPLRPTLFVILLLLLFPVLSAPAAAEDEISDGRINEVWHFGGDVLYCNHEEGCTFLNMNGQPLWHIPQADIEAAMALACETREPQYIAAGFGTYGPSTLSLHCYEGMEPYLILSAYDEWEVLSDLKFGPAYVPVGPPPSTSKIEKPSKPDQDRDGIPDEDDECPTKGDEGYGVDDYGCPNEPPT